MDRRHFCKIASMAIGAIGLGNLPLKAGELSASGNRAGLRFRCRATVLRRECHLDLQALYLDDPDTGPCSLLNSGDEFIIEPGRGCPQGFCPMLWDMICHSSTSSADCRSALSGKTSVIACPDGTRPVIVRLDYL
ncbi:MAG: TIGR04076 family protein [Bacteroides sp.]|nr:TIGR04076 family protein [Bacteroides sp.]